MKEYNDKIHQLENEFQVEEIEYKGIKLWANIRIYLFDKLLSTSNGVIRRGGFSTTSIVIILKGLFYYNPFRIFQKWDIWLFVAADRRKIIDNIAIHRVSGAIPEIYNKTLIIEKPFPRFHYPKKQIAERNIISESWLFAVTYICEIWYRLVRPNIKNEDILVQIIQDCKLEFDYRGVIYRFLAQYVAMKMLLQVTFKPKVIFIEAPYNSMGYILAFKSFGIKVLEMQHGVINENHYAYNSNLLNHQYSPDRILVYGDVERRCFEQKNKCYIPNNNISVVGSYILERIKEQKNNNILSSERKYYQTIVVVSAQELIEDKLIEFVNNVAGLDETILYVYVPRKEKKYGNKMIRKNVKIIFGNIYDIIKESDIHSTVFSTTCLEAQYLEKVNVFINIDNLSYSYYGNIMNLSNGAYYADNAEEYVCLVKEHKCDRVFPDSTFFADNHKERLTDITKEYIGSSFI